MSKAKGYKAGFLGRRLKVTLPSPGDIHKKDLAPVKGTRSSILHYTHHSVALSRKRKFPLFTAVNINSVAFQNVKRNSLFPGGNDRWQVDDRAKDYQWGAELYSIKDSDFDKGHLVKREDPQWGDDEVIAADAARSTFYFSNCAPQVPELNRREWLSLEDYILKKESAPNRLKVSVFTGPVLSDNDPVFVHPIKGEEVQIPVLFWKVIYFTADGKSLNRVAFLMGQEELLLKRRIVRPKVSELESVVSKPEYFNDFEDASTYQVSTSMVEDLTGLAFSPASDPFKETRLVKIILKQVEVSDLESFPGDNAIGYEMEGLVLR